MERERQRETERDGERQTDRHIQREDRDTGEKGHIFTNRSQVLYGK